MAEINDTSKNTILNQCTPDPLADFIGHVGRGGATGIGVGLLEGRIAPLAGVTPLVGAVEGLPIGMIDGGRTEVLRIVEGNTANAGCVADRMQRQSHGSITPSDKITAMHECTEGTLHNPWVGAVIGAGEGAVVGGGIGSMFPGGVSKPVGALSGALVGFGTGFVNAVAENELGETTVASCVADRLQVASQKPEPTPVPPYTPPLPYGRPYSPPSRSYPLQVNPIYPPPGYRYR